MSVHDPNNHPSVYKEHVFFWNTLLSQDEMDAIVLWIRSLTPEQRKLLDQLLEDVRRDAVWDFRETISP